MYQSTLRPDEPEPDNCKSANQRSSYSDDAVMSPCCC